MLGYETPGVTVTRLKQGEGNQPTRRCTLRAMETIKGFQWKAEPHEHVVSISVQHVATTTAWKEFSASLLAQAGQWAARTGGWAHAAQGSLQRGARLGRLQAARLGVVRISPVPLWVFSANPPQAEFAQLVELALSLLFFWQTKDFLPDKNSRPAPRLGAGLRRIWHQAHLSLHAVWSVRLLAAYQWSRGDVSLNPIPGTRVSAQSGAAPSPSPLRGLLEWCTGSLLNRSLTSAGAHRGRWNLNPQEQPWSEKTETGQTRLRWMMRERVKTPVNHKELGARCLQHLHHCCWWGVSNAPASPLALASASRWRGHGQAVAVCPSWCPASSAGPQPLPHNVLVLQKGF